MMTTIDRLIQWRADNPATYKANAKQRMQAWRKANPDKYRQQMIRNNQAKFNERRIIKSVNIIRHNPNEVYQLINHTVNRALPKHMRDDIISAMCLAILEGKLLVSDIQAKADEYRLKHNRMFDTFKTVSFNKMEWRL